MKRYTAMDKITNIISYSQSYVKHKHHLLNAASCIDTSTHKRNQSNAQLLHQQYRFKKVYQKMNQKQIDKDNEKFIDRVTKIYDKNVQNLTASQLRLKKLSETTHRSLKTSKARERQQKSKSIQKANKINSSRISLSRSKDSLGPEKHLKEYNQQRKYSNIIGRYSERSQNILHALISKNLKIKDEDIPFLPQITNRKYRHRELSFQK